MDKNQIEELIRQLKASGLDEEEIMEIFFETFQKGKMDRADLETLAGAMGYELTDDFKNDETPDPIASDVEGLDKEDLEDAKTLDGLEEVAEEEDIDLDSDSEEEEEGSDSDYDNLYEEDEEEDEDEESDYEDSEEEDSDSEREEAMKLFRLNK
jgi:hypothetical protein